MVLRQLVRCVLPLQVPYRAAVGMRNKAFDWGWKSAYRADVPVVSIGNLTTGGTGKTPTTLFFAQHFSLDRRVAILSRGYKSQAEKGEHPLLVAAYHTAEEVGDEPLLLARSLPQVQVWVHPNRVASAQRAIENGAQLLILDDGFQHRHLHRDEDWVIVDASSPFGVGGCLPWGSLRESPSALKRATRVLIRAESQQAFHETAQQVARYCDAPTEWLRFHVREPLDMHGQPVNLNGHKIAAFCGIAHPQQFRSSLEALGARLCTFTSYRDHRGPDDAQLVQMAQAARSQGARYLVCTDKDWVRFASVPPLSIPLVRLGLEAEASSALTCKLGPNRA